MPTIQRNPTSNGYCVPSALSALTGLTVDQSIDLLKESLGDQRITGVYYPEILRALTKLGFKYIEISETFRKKNKGLYLLCFKGHVGVIDGYSYIDNQWPDGTPTDKGNFKGYKRTPQRIFRVERPSAKETKNA